MPDQLHKRNEFAARHRLLSVGIVLFVALVGAGCGEPDRAAYERELAEVGRSVDESLAQMPDSENETLTVEDAQELADDLREASAKLNDIQPPDDAAEAHKALIRGLRGVGASYDQLSTDLDGAPDNQRAQIFVAFFSSKRFESGIDDIERAQQLYADQGYSVFRTENKPS